MDGRETDSVRMVFLRDQIGHVPSKQYPDIAADLLVHGYDSPALRELAGHPRSDPLGARDLWLQARQELGRPFEDDSVARRVLVRNWLHEIVDGTLAPRTGAGLTFREGWLALGQPTELDHLVVLMDDWDDMPRNREDICGQIVAAARTALTVW
ncbi:hypothetical protein SAMN04489743_1272 [Pseudarthrobacter equi]|uniref:Uncharacterized protein n=1 Tax=Pseudarthrobacter equi TaxID=728066 RepID=A0A1H1WAI2_9MICC|nr:hypothetical protein [Pseudarthrobacter equi]SDS94338.1 hypothetical protein SAMN04489743_1272 [Pseudarthrobacter equi]